MTRHDDTMNHPTAIVRRIALSATFVAASIGCGGSSTPVVQQPETPAAPTASGTESPVAAADGQDDAGSATKKTHRRDEVWVDEKGQKWFGNVPFDAFFDQPYAVASDATPVGGGNAAVTATTTTNTEPSTSGDSDLLQQMTLRRKSPGCRRLLRRTRLRRPRRKRRVVCIDADCVA